MATDKRLQSIEEFPHISWIIGALRERLSFETNAGYHQDPAGAGAPLPSSSFSPSFFSFFDRVGKLFFMSLLPLAVPFFSCPCLSPALSLSVLF